MNIFVLVRAIIYAAVFVGFLLVYIPNQLLAGSGIVRRSVIGAPQIAGMIITAIGALIAFWCILTFVLSGKERRRHLIRPADS